MTIPLADNSLILLKKIDDTSINSLDDIEGKVVGVVTGTAIEKLLKEHDVKLKQQGKKGVKEFKQYASNPEARMELQNGRIDVMIQSMPVANYIIKQTPGVFAIVDFGANKTYVSWAVRKEDKDLLEFLDKEILKLKQSGKLKELQEKWFGVSWDLPDQLP